MDNIDQFIADIENEKIKNERKPATVGDVKTSERKVLITTYKIIEAFKQQIKQDNDELTKNLLSEVRTTSEVLKGYFGRTDEFLTRIEKQIRKNNNDNRKIKTEVKILKSQIENFDIIQQ